MFKLFKRIYRYRSKEAIKIQTALRPIEDFKNDWISLDKEGRLIVQKHYAWNGCSPTFSVLDLFIIGTPDGILEYGTGKPILYIPSLCHDACTQFYKELTELGVSTKEIDFEFYKQMKAKRFTLSFVYYRVVRIVTKLKDRP